MFSWNLLHDVRVALRSFLKAPGLTFVVVLTLAVAIGANTAIFTVLDGVLLQPLPYPDEDRIVRVAAAMHPPGGRRRSRPVLRPRLLALRQQQPRVRELRRLQGGAAQLPLTGDGPPLQVNVATMTVSAFGCSACSRSSAACRPTKTCPAGPVGLLSNALWVNQYGGDPSIRRQVIDLNGQQREVIGVMPSGYDFPTPRDRRLAAVSARPGQRELRRALHLRDRAPRAGRHDRSATSEAGVSSPASARSATAGVVQRDLQRRRWCAR